MPDCTHIPGAFEGNLSGYYGDDVTCEDIDECDELTDTNVCVRLNSMVTVMSVEILMIAKTLTKRESSKMLLMPYSTLTDVTQMASVQINPVFVAVYLMMVTMVMVLNVPIRMNVEILLRW